MTEITFEFLRYYKGIIEVFENQSNILGASHFQIHRANFAQKKQEEEYLSRFGDGG